MNARDALVRQLENGAKLSSLATRAYTKGTVHSSNCPELERITGVIGIGNITLEEVLKAQTCECHNTLQFNLNKNYTIKKLAKWVAKVESFQTRTPEKINLERVVELLENPPGDDETLSRVFAPLVERKRKEHLEAVLELARDHAGTLKRELEEKHAKIELFTDSAQPLEDYSHPAHRKLTREIRKLLQEAEQETLADPRRMLIWELEPQDATETLIVELYGKTEHITVVPLAFYRQYRSVEHTITKTEPSPAELETAQTLRLDAQGQGAYRSIKQAYKAARSLA